MFMSVNRSQKPKYQESNTIYLPLNSFSNLLTLQSEKSLRTNHFLLFFLSTYLILSCSSDLNFLMSHFFLSP